jgi:hypothetical protein
MILAYRRDLRADRKGADMSQCPHICNEPDSEGDYLCTAPRIFGDSRHADDRGSTPCTTVDADDCLIYQRARAEAAERVVRLLEAVARIAESALERSVQLAAGLVGNGRWDGTEAGALSMDARNAQIVVAEALASVATLNLPEKELCQSPSDQTTSDTEPPSDAAAEGEEAQ